MSVVKNRSILSVCQKFPPVVCHRDTENTEYAFLKGRSPCFLWLCGRERWWKFQCAFSIGSEKGELIPLRDEQGNLTGYKKDRAGNVVMTKLDQLTLEKISVLTDGQFYHVSSGGIELEKIYDDIARMEKTERDTRLVTHYEEQYQYFIAIALALLLIETFLTDRKSLKTLWKWRFN